MSAVIAPPNAWQEMQQVRGYARELGISPGKAVNEYIESGYAKSYVSHIAEAARRARMAKTNAPELPPCA
ncbi:hypothetical protein ACQR5V_21605 [Xanthomonas oryzae pv. oryzicola]|uniref:hypothetical protein n=1 Tax=Xanthomonas oryzae TaxID=347 RepID=UPI0005CE117E|nr:hypothetical protein [Xanthomonas oryzae]AJQ88085.1 hypothetical protein BE73_14280 [Xanthomonas oryzae pv. oryzicola]AVU02471.1 hypothetical protein C0L90_08420 [Xanthomonas oryzae pv. oryzae]OWB26826.1 hypothetical protein XocBAI21_17345 [Xanthomonas oryzae pv. oryzicola]QBI15669.1 hypothetical protein EYR03_08470 [Xanthomonas oryzae pv. oryzae]QBI15727.1 hypothetical protein EYR03_08790 [Xanthomonas oryzae pv. oryzae]